MHKGLGLNFSKGAAMFVINKDETYLSTVNDGVPQFTEEKALAKRFASESMIASFLHSYPEITGTTPEYVD